MSLNDSAYTSTPTIVRDMGRFVDVSVTDTAAIATLGVSGATTLAGTLTANGVSTFNAAANFNQAVTIGTSVMTTATVNSLLYAANGGTIGANSSSTLTVNSTETHNGPETHNGAVSLASTLAVTGVSSLGPVSVTGRTTYNVYEAPDGNVSVGDVPSGFIVFVGISATRYLDITNVPPVGTVVWVGNDSNTHNVIIRGPGMITIGSVGGSTNGNFAMLVYTSAGWRRFETEV